MRNFLVNIHSKRSNQPFVARVPPEAASESARARASILLSLWQIGWIKSARTWWEFSGPNGRGAGRKKCWLAPADLRMNGFLSKDKCRDEPAFFVQFQEHVSHALI